MDPNGQMLPQTQSVECNSHYGQHCITESWCFLNTACAFSTQHNMKGVSAIGGLRLGNARVRYITSILSYGFSSRAFLSIAWKALGRVEKTVEESFQLDISTSSYLGT